MQEALVAARAPAGQQHINHYPPSAVSYKITRDATNVCFTNTPVVIERFEGAYIDGTKSLYAHCIPTLVLSGLSEYQ